MALLNPAVVEGIRLVVRQTTGAATTILTDAIQTASATSTTATATSTPSSTTSVAAPTDTLANGPGNPVGGNGNNNNNNNNNNSGGSNSSPLLFFVALGFGVVFTNLWIIVGVKYCFRYNARSRQLRLAEDGEPINMENMPRPHRRRREKKLMSMDEVNEKFPMVKYKTWVSSRAQEGLPTRGGVLVPPSRPGSLHDAESMAPELPSKERMSTEGQPTTSATPAVKAEKQDTQYLAKESTSSTAAAVPRASTDAPLVPMVSESATLSKETNRVSHDDDDEEDEHINAALPPECMGTSGDTCAICIDTLEDDDDVRGLTCGHAFHAVCLDPWLTSRRACCPLCKADYYTPKPRPAAAEPGDGTTGVITVTLPGDSRSRINMPNRPRHAFLGLRRPGRPVPSHVPVSSQATINAYTARSPVRIGFIDRMRRGNTVGQPPASSQSTPPRSSAEQANPGGMLSTFRNAFPALRAARTTENASEGPVASANSGVTPSNLEAGVRSPAS
ncbi:hypothetical protein B0H67DRAFT_596495 [Lasiosphaeris hirsuta]|uniref:RING-type domain-containing protein n=1 Tax=Lasiosphaeris hirsuta TaxID=260670 RepID=A0AA40EAQ5_9PEZI|nr:hypothetical protein B0H67DRAFT_596495 [Lasiosphaeris hirsuta]